MCGARICSKRLRLVTFLIPENFLCTRLSNAYIRNWVASARSRGCNRCGVHFNRTGALRGIACGATMQLSGGPGTPNLRSIATVLPVWSTGFSHRVGASRRTVRLRPLFFAGMQVWGWSLRVGKYQPVRVGGLAPSPDPSHKTRLGSSLLGQTSAIVGPSLLYSPEECVEQEFSEVGVAPVLR